MDVNLILGYIFENKTQKQKRQMVSDSSHWFKKKTQIFSLFPIVKTSRKHAYIVPFKPHFYTVKLEFTGVYTDFLFSAQKYRLWIYVRIPSSTHNLCFEQKYENYQNFSSERFYFLVVKFSMYMNRRVFVM